MADVASVAIVIVSYNVGAELNACLESIGAHLRSPTEVNRQIVVVDNGSTDGTQQMLRERWPAVRLLEAGGNVGFSRANNLGIRATTSEYVLLLNPDTLVRAGALDRLLSTLAARRDAAIAAPRLIDGQGVAELSFGPPLSPIGELRQKVIGSLHQRGVAPVRRLVNRWTQEPGPRPWVSGACMLIRRSDLEDVDLLDERFFMYTEDVDLCVRLRQRGRAILFVPDAVVVHLRGQSAKRNPRTERLRRASQLAYYAKHNPAWVPLLKTYLRLRGKLPLTSEGGAPADAVPGTGRRPTEP